MRQGGCPYPSKLYTFQGIIWMVKVVDLVSRLERQIGGGLASPLRGAELIQHRPDAELSVPRPVMLYYRM
jgi:hypothetical protein